MTFWSFWTWFILAGILLTMEILVPGVFFLWIGIAAALTGVVVWLFPAMSAMLQLICFSVLAIISILAWRKLYRNPEVHDESIADHRGAQYIGRTFTLRVPIEDGIGKLTVDDTTWRIQGEDCEVGQKVKVTGISGVNLTVESIEQTGS